MTHMNKSKLLITAAVMVLIGLGVQHFLVQPEESAAPTSNVAARSQGEAVQTGQEHDNLDRLIIASPAKELPKLPFAQEDGVVGEVSRFRGKYVLLNYWATWCGPCREEMPSLEALETALAGDRFQVVTISVDRTGFELPRQFLDKIQIKRLPLLVDLQNDGPRALGLRGLPVTLIINPEGQEIARLLGPNDWFSPRSQALFQKLIDENQLQIPKKGG